ncbi:Receptor-like protein 6 [Arabidopsis thaliana]|uniref:Receptor-like protein 6 n=3 Tax=Arabidopsis TaxID=3701 RepID=RLP6_ARATH|nr:receptor like protein 6 [Arabidopsis thaliana]Q9C637.1 RecName: Full=Receptor-like protein 6; Short=AtRLP6; Flags: Precursor [Arabidopsis thaliana]KAG7648806.1 Leucine-rich repeat [Arabidopsis thaliana x Arabidopsis arenosa]AAG50623.1 disease resistance protein, putative [Arabidopsis thaliana]AEE32120.1 receptor like protein 6 [Arabidopsis thaliana]OAP13241.1 RLP6 [Arabidopsis thaliana]|eukprot:NP_175139.1 receptor like protein 6 [Arabidopsis thaliana]
MTGLYSSMSFFLRTIVLLFSTSSFCNTFASLTQDSCHPDQRDALLEFKNEFKIWYPNGFLDIDGVLMDVTSYPKTKSWTKNSDCCYWDGITCDTKSGKVTGLDLSCSCLHGRLEPNSSLFRLQHLQSVNLAYNNFTNSPIPAEFSKFMRLERLNLSRSSFSGHISIKLLQLTNLVSLDLSSSFPYSPSSLSIEKPLFLHLLALNFMNLRELDMSSVDISSAIPIEFSYMWSLRSLTLKGCNLLGRFPNSVLLIPNLESISLDHNLNLEGSLPNFLRNNSLLKLSIYNTSFSGTIPNSISNLKHLTSLKLQQSAFSGRIPSSLRSLSHLSNLVLSENNFVGEIPSSVSNLKQLTLFDVSDNNLNGNFPSSLLNLNQLRYIDICSNHFTGFLPPTISQLSNLEFFSACDNSFTGSIPSSLFNISSLTTLGLSYNQLNDTTNIKNISLLHNLQRLLLDNNNFKASQVDLDVFLSLKRLVSLALSGIPLSTTNITSDSEFSSHLEYLELSGCNIIEFPEFIRNQRNLSSIDLSNNNIKGQVPNWLWRLPELSTVDLSNNSLIGFNGSLKALSGSKIVMLDLSSNAFQGPLFMPPRGIQYFLGSYNNFTGYIPPSICGLANPLILDLSNNNLHGLIPRCLEAQMSSLSVLNLRNNSLDGSLPNIFMNAKVLSSLDVSHNTLEGKLPASLAGCSALEILNVESNNINDTFPFWLNSLPKLQVLVLRSNNFRGTLHNVDGVWFGFPLLRITDVSHNDFVGTLPSDYFMNWTAISKSETELQYIGDPEDYGYYTSLVLMNKGVSMEMQRILTKYTVIDFAGNKIQGKIPESVGILKELHVLNLSSNAFTGHIPSSLANLTNLESLDISQNKIGGEIPPELGTLSSLEWINVSHNQLVGSIPQGTQFHRQNCSSYEGNPGIYGSSLKDVCGDIHAPRPPQAVLPHSSSSSSEEDELISWIAACLGFAPGMVFGLTMGYIMTSHKHEWFMDTFGRRKGRSTRTR